MSQQQFTTELKYIRNVSLGTLELYEHSFRHFAGALESKAAVIQRVAEMRERGVKPVSDVPVVGWRAREWRHHS